MSRWITLIPTFPTMLKTPLGQPVDHFLRLLIEKMKGRFGLLQTLTKPLHHQVGFKPQKST